jgi:hypothetical protein
MSAPVRWSLPSLAAAVLTLAAGSASAHPGQPGGLRPAPQHTPFPYGQPNVNPGNPLLMPSINTWPGLPFYQMGPPVMGLPDWSNQGGDNPWMNRRNGIRPNPFAMNPFWANPFALNPLLRNPGNNQFNNPFAVPGSDSRFTPEFAAASPPVSYIPPASIRPSGAMPWKVQDPHMNAGAGTIYRPTDGVVTLADGSSFYRVPGNGILSRPGPTAIFMPYIR